MSRQEIEIQRIRFFETLEALTGSDSLPLDDDLGESDIDYLNSLQKVYNRASLSNHSAFEF